MTAHMGKIFVCCPAGIVTGGPELLHQLVHELRAKGHDAYISYYPYDSEATCPEPYRCYDIALAEIEDRAGNLVIVPELGTFLLKTLKQARGAIWWLSVDNYAGATGDSRLRDAYALARLFVRGKWQPRSALKGHMHFVQSQYAASFLKAAGIRSLPLSDYLGPAHLSLKSTISAERRNIIAYNPRKGFRTTAKLIENNPEFEFRAIENMTGAQVSQLLASAKVYIDFGNHPGKDRMPREAAMAGCCVITGRRGSAGFQQDVPIAEIYKMNEGLSGFQDSFTRMVQAIFKNFATHQALFSGYREIISNEPEQFRREVAAIFGANTDSEANDAARETDGAMDARNRQTA